MTHAGALSRPMMRRAARLHRYQAAGLARKDPEQLRARDQLTERLAPGRMRTVRLKNRLRDIQPDGANFLQGRPLLIVRDTPTLAQNAVGGRPSHQAEFAEAPSRRLGYAPPPKLPPRASRNPGILPVAGQEPFAVSMN
jgi:hypothetical protein